MKSYDMLTELGKKRRMNEVACIALNEYDIDVKSVSYLAEETNMFYKVNDFAGNKYALKICEELNSKIEDNLAEIFFIDQVTKKSDIIVPEIVFTKDGRGVVTVSHAGFEVDQRVVVYKWLIGKEIDEREDDKYFFSLGVVMAKLHKATKDLVIPNSISTKKWNKVFYFREEVSVYKENKYQKFITKECQEIMDFIIPYLDAQLEKYYIDAKTQLIHGDLNPYNVWTKNDSIAVIDFEDAILGLPIHDFAIALFYYKHDEKFDYDKVKKLLFKGYSVIKPLMQFDDRDIELFITARRVNFINYGLQVIDDPTEYIRTNIERVKDFIRKFV